MSDHAASSAVNVVTPHVCEGDPCEVCGCICDEIVPMIQRNPDCEAHTEERSLEADFYYDSQNGVWVYKWADSRLVLTMESVLEYQEDRRVR